MKDGPPLRVVQRRRPIARAQQERREHRGGDQLQAQSPPDSAEKSDGSSDIAPYYLSSVSKTTNLCKSTLPRVL